MKISNMNQIMKIAQLSNDAVHMVGLHGIGKSQVVEGFSKENNNHLEILMLSQQEVADLIGMPTEENGITYWSKPVWLKRMEDAAQQGKRTILFLDELARAPLEVRQAALQLVLDRRIHEHHLPEVNGIKCLVVAADNPAELYQTDELDAALLDRFMTYNVETDVNGWLKWARSNNLNPVITDYVAEYPEKLHFCPALEGDSTDKGSTPRGWAKLSDVLEHIDVIDESLIFDVFVSKIGDSVGANFFHWFNNYINVIKVEDILENIGKAPIITQEEQEKASEKLKEITTKIEAISASELAQKLKVAQEEGEINFNVISVYIGSLNVEIGNGIAKQWKNDKENEFFYKWAETVPNKYLFTRVVEIASN